MEAIEQLAKANQDQARELLRTADLLDIWRSVGAQPNLVGSLRMGLLVKHRDIDLHIYSDPLILADSFAAIARLAEDPNVERIEYRNLLATEECCIEWHAWYRFRGELWQLDMIHMPKGSPYDGYFERVADRMVEVLTPETRNTILRLKYQVEEGVSVAGIEYYRAVLEGGVRTWAEFSAWRAAHPLDSVWEWLP